MIAPDMKKTILSTLDYWGAKKATRDLCAKIATLQRQLSEAETREQSFSHLDTILAGRTAKTLKLLLLFVDGLVFSDTVFPVSSAVLTAVKSKQMLTVKFASPVFNGWKTKAPNYSYQSCPAQLETPPAPSPNHIPLYESDSVYTFSRICWDYRDCSLVVWDTDSAGSVMGAELRLTECVGLLLARISSGVKS